jgi:hypothetical protein
MTASPPSPLPAHLRPVERFLAAANIVGGVGVRVVDMREPSDENQKCQNCPHGRYLNLILGKRTALEVREKRHADDARFVGTRSATRRVDDSAKGAEKGSMSKTRPPHYVAY